jgi:hypothetical protein
LNEVDVVRRLVHDRAAVELPRPAPRLGVVVFLRSLPANGNVRHVNSPEAPLVDRSLQQLDRRVEPVLLDHEQLDTGFVARMYQLISLGQ